MPTAGVVIVCSIWYVIGTQREGDHVRLFTKEIDLGSICMLSIFIDTSI